MIHRIKSETHSAVLPHFLGKRHPVFFNLRTETLYFFSPIAVALHTTVAKLRICLKTKLLCLLCTVFHKLVIKLIKLLLNAFVKLICLRGSLSSYIAIFIVQIRDDRGKIQRLALPVD